MESRDTKTFRIVAYSFGTFVAHLVIKSLEKLGYTGSFIYIDGSPIWLENLIKQIKLMDVLEVQKRVVLLTLQTILNPDEILYLKKLISQDTNLETIFSSIKQNIKLDNMDQCMQYLNAVLSITDAMINPDTFKLVEIIGSKMLMISPTKLLQPNLDQFYGLKPITRNTIDVATVEGDHQSVLQNDNIPNIINKFFGINSN